MQNDDLKIITDEMHTKKINKTANSTRNVHWISVSKNISCGLPSSVALDRNRRELMHTEQPKYQLQNFLRSHWNLPFARNSWRCQSDTTSNFLSLYFLHIVDSGSRNNNNEKRLGMRCMRVLG